jgi:hypothetical protein
MLCFAAACCLALAACDHEPTFDASSLPAYQKSLSIITARLNQTDQHKLQVALLTLAAGSSADYTAFALANPSIIANLEALDGIANPLTFLDRMRQGIGGRTAAYVIRHVADDLDFAISRAEGNGAEKTLAAFVIENARLNFDRGNPNDRRYRLPTVEFSVFNGSKDPITGIYLSGELTAPDRATSLAVGDVVYHFVQPLQPGAQQEIKVLLGAPSEWTQKQLNDTYNADFKLRVSNIDDSSGKRLTAINVGRLDVMRKKRDLLRGSS